MTQNTKFEKVVEFDWKIFNNDVCPENFINLLLLPLSYLTWAFVWLFLLPFAIYIYFRDKKVYWRKMK